MTSLFLNNNNNNNNNNDDNNKEKKTLREVLSDAKSQQLMENAKHLACWRKIPLRFK